MFIRRSKVTRGNKTYEYAQLVVSYRHGPNKVPRHRVIASLKDLNPLEIENLEAALDATRQGRKAIVAPLSNLGKRAPKTEANLRYLDIAVFRALFESWGLPGLLGDLLGEGEGLVPPAKVVEALVYQRLNDPNTKIHAVQWFPRTALPELLDIAPATFNNSRIHRALDVLETATPALMAKLPTLYRQRHGAFLSLFLDVTDTWFVGHGPPGLAAWGKTKEGMLRRKIGIVLMCTDKGLPLRWQVVRGTRHDSQVMTAMLREVKDLKWLGTAPVVMDRAMGKSAQLSDLLDMKLRFLTALTRVEFNSYAPTLPWQGVQCLPSGPDPEALAAQAAARVEADGMHRVDDTLFVMDLGTIELPNDTRGRTAPPPIQPGLDRNAHVLSLAQRVRQAVLDGRHGSYAAAGRPLGLGKSLISRYRALLRLPEDLQRTILDGKTARYALEDLLRIAALDGPDTQRAAFDALLASPPPRRVRATLPAPPPAAPEPSPEQEALASSPRRVRVVAYFNPARFVEQRHNAEQQLQAMQDFVAELNKSLAGPRPGHRTQKTLLASVDRQLRSQHLLEVFDVKLQCREVLGRQRYQVQLTLKPDVWDRYRRYDGFSVLVAHEKVSQSATELCLLYRAKDAVEKDFQVIKSVTDLRPIWHRTQPKILAHVTLCMLALLLERTLRDQLKGAYTAGRAMEELKACHLNRYLGSTDDILTLYSTTQLTTDQRNILRKLGLLHLADDDHVCATITPQPTSL